MAGTGNLDVGQHVVQCYGRDEGVAGYPIDALRTFALSAYAAAAAAARHFAADAVLRRGAANMTDDVALVVTELAANAIVHAQTGFTVALSVQRDLVRISVWDRCPVPPEGAALALPPAPLHGLGAVNDLASRWGVVPLGSAGKEVWVELRR